MSDADDPRPSPLPEDEELSLLDAPAFLGQALDAHLPALREHFAAVAVELRDATRYIHGFGGDTALTTVMHHANNTLVDGLFDLQHARGRPALAGDADTF